MIFEWVRKQVLRGIGKPLAATAEVWDQWIIQAKVDYPFIYFIFDTIPTFYWRKKRQLRDFVDNVKQKYFFGYHYLKLDVKRFVQPYGKESLSNYSWFDSDEQIELFMFQILVNYVEKEIGYETLKQDIVDGEDLPFHYKEAFDLYEWFVNDYCDNSYSSKLYRELHAKYPDHADIDIISFISYGNQKTPKTDYEIAYMDDLRAVQKLDRKHRIKKTQETTENLIRLINLRKSFWT